MEMSFTHNEINNVNEFEINRKESAKYLGVQPETMAVWASTGRYKLPYMKIGKEVRYRKSDLYELKKSSIISIRNQ